ncbi:MAG: LysR family transcriptional regulator [Sphingomonas sp.]|uniref:LysR family transcriptional regulator n=1 Tax=Sphingomonas sp. TaxID=28214 RepID=UPI0026377505|nr:LysR family transcriptional regulator [Sphingomonas sp.]MDK2769734.1 LysR family transcriptional regulator [Sphingomonas sp.]
MPDQPNPAARPARSHWTPAKQRAFLTALVETGSVACAARAAGMSRSSAHALRARLTGTPFDHHWSHALKLHAARLADPFAPDPLAPRKAPGDSPRRAPIASASRP